MRAHRGTGPDGLATIARAVWFAALLVPVQGFAGFEIGTFSYTDPANPSLPRFVAVPGFSVEGATSHGQTVCIQVTAGPNNPTGIYSMPPPHVYRTSVYDVCIRTSLANRCAGQLAGRALVPLPGYIEGANHPPSNPLCQQFPQVCDLDTAVSFIQEQYEGWSGTGWLPNAQGQCTSPPSTGLTLRPARMTIRDWRLDDEHEFAQDPPFVTLYGRTVVPLEVRVVDSAGQPVVGEAVTLRAGPVGATVDPQSFGFSTTPAGGLLEELSVTTGADGKATVYFRVETLWANVLEDESNPTEFRITARRGSDTPVEARVPVVDNRERILARYSVATEYIADGARSFWRDYFLPPLTGSIADLPGGILGAVFQPGNTGRGSILCNEYQSFTLTFLNDIRHSDDGWLLNGLDYSPLQTKHTEHHFVALYPEFLEYDSTRTLIMDPWLAQTSTVYTWREFVNFIDTLSAGANIVPDLLPDPGNPGTCVVNCGDILAPPPYPALGGRYPFFPDNESLPIRSASGGPVRYDGCLSIPTNYCARLGLGGSPDPHVPIPRDHATIVIGSPVLFHVVMEDGRRFGFPTHAPDVFTNDFAGSFTTAFLSYPEPEGERGWYVEIPPGRRFRLELPVLADGSMSLAVLTTDGAVWGGYEDVPIASGETVAIAVDLDSPCGPLSLPGGGQVECATSTGAECTADTDCADPEPCTVDTCETGRCVHQEATGFAAARCVCERFPAAACEAQAVPSAIAKKAAKACDLLASSETSEGKKQRKLVAKAVKSWKKAARLAGKRALRKKLSSECIAALTQALSDGSTRSLRLRDAL